MQDNKRYGVGDMVRVTTSYPILGKPSGTYRVVAIFPDEYDGKAVLHVRLADESGETRGFFYEDCERVDG